MQTVALSGAGGFLGSALARKLSGNGYTVRRLVRRTDNLGEDEIPWSVERGILQPELMQGAQAVIHLSGEPLLGLWTEGKKKKIYDSRVVGTCSLAQSLAELSPGPRTLLSASAVGYYGDREDEALTERSLPGEGFLAKLAQDWERSTDGARKSGMRVVNMRIGIIMGRDGGALKKMLTPFRLGLGGKLGSGAQYMSWMSLTDFTRAVAHVLANDSIAGAVNITGPNPVTNKEFTKALGRALHRPTVFSVPSFVLRAAPGKQADEMFLASLRVIPRTLLDSGFVFDHEYIEDALSAALNN